ncbi:MAG: CPBP family intramembrane metalloprotease [Fibromonadales bacterium]|nr:CPBP family intramembrane metalloprotease [Fibromonadales bacterium]
MFHSLKFLWLDFVAFLRQDFKPLPYIYTFTVIVIALVFVYSTKLGYSLGKCNIPTPNRFVNGILLFSGLYFLIAVPVLIMQGQYKSIPKLHFYLKGLALTAAIGVTNAFLWRNYIDFSSFSRLEKSYLIRLLWCSRVLIIELPLLLLLRFFVDRQQKGLYGLCRGNHHIKAYMWLFVLVLPILIGVSFTHGFRAYYPMGKVWLYGDGLFGYPAWANLLVLELAYLARFVMVELVFRGALVVGMGNVMSRSAVLPMVAVYVALHFNKPILETTSAIFGGFFLGALAYQTKHIWGGVIIHISVAFAIEAVRLAQYYAWGWK